MTDGDVPQGDLSEKQLKEGYWYVTHILNAKKGIAGVSIAIVACIWVFALIFSIFLYLVFLTPYRATLNELKTAVVQPLPGELVHPLTQSASGVLSRQTVDATLYTLFVEVENKNTTYRADFDGVFTTSSGELKSVREFLMPGEKKYIILPSLYQDPGTPIFEMNNTIWTRLSERTLVDVRKKLNLIISDEIPFMSTPSSRGGVEGIYKTTFRLVNNTGYGYREIRLPIALKSGTQVTAIQQVILQNVRPSESRAVEARWPQEFQGIDDADITPVIDVLDPQAFFLQEERMQRHFDSDRQIR